MRQPDPIRVLIVDDHAVVRSGLAVFLLAFDDLEQVGEAGSGEEAIALCQTLRPDVVLMDLAMPEMNGAAATRQIRQALPHVQVLALTSFRENHLVQSALRAGAIGCLLKNLSAAELAAAIRAAHAGRATPALDMSVPGPGHRQTIGFDLTPREREVLALLTEGLNNLDIAERLAVSRSTVKFHVSTILSKLGASSRTEAVALALHNRLVK